MKYRTAIRYLILLFAIGISAVGYYIFKNSPPPIVRAVGDLNVNWGVPDGDPIFVVMNMLPGDVESRTVEVVNGASSPRPVAIRGIKRAETASFSAILDFVISEEGTDLYGGVSATGLKTLQNFFDETATPSSVPLSTIDAGDTTHYTFKATFPASAGNEYQKALVIFDLILGIDSPIPPECLFIEFSGPPIFGTENDDFIQGTLGNDLVFALEGNDRVFTFGGDDCIVGGPGNDELRGETGKDIIFGNEGDDLVVGADGKDKLFGGDGNDTIRGENNDDYIEGGTGNDFITGGNGDDIIYAQDGNDTVRGENGDDAIDGGAGIDNLDGGAGSDTVHGDAGDDTINGKANNDFLYGDADFDTIDGSSGTDTCDGEVEANCEL